MPPSQRPASGLATRRTAMRPPVRRTGAAASASDRSQSPADALKPVNGNARSLKSPNPPAAAGTKRKERDFESSPDDTNIHVVVRCRGRNNREIKENSGVVISTDGTRGNTVEVSMGPNAVSNKTYHFDKVFSAAADQSTIYEDVMLPILNEVSKSVVIFQMAGAR
jgi:kinesin family protein 11